MAIINFNSKNNNDIDVNELMKDSLEQSRTLEELVDEAPYVLDGHDNFRLILRNMKRGLSFEEAVKNCCALCCPPGVYPDEDYCDLGCSNCWIDFIRNYQTKISNKT